jgi:hypothetical protein
LNLGGLESCREAISPRGSPVLHDIPAIVYH